MWTETEIVALCQNNDVAACRAMVVLFKRQTSQEQAVKQTLRKNRFGVAQGDAKFLSEAAEWCMNGTDSFQRKLGGTTTRHGWGEVSRMELAKHFCHKYRRQLTAIANGDRRTADEI